MSRDRLRQRLEELRSQTGNTVDTLNKTLNTTGMDRSVLQDQLHLVKELEQRVIDLQVGEGGWSSGL